MTGDDVVNIDGESTRILYEGFDKNDEEGMILLSCVTFHANENVFESSGALLLIETTLANTCIVEGNNVCD